MGPNVFPIFVTSIRGFKFGNFAPDQNMGYSQPEKTVIRRRGVAVCWEVRMSFSDYLSCENKIKFMHVVYPT